MAKYHDGSNDPCMTAVDFMSNFILSTTINRGKSGGHYLILLLNSLNLVLHLMFNAFHPSVVLIQEIIMASPVFPT